eukprot:TRINITY_DN652_c0_g2_i4.p1 TRINITY_DN652_c0_g2~~TRINITY_DN652_c0_g2_i4.p1  ORF type:complete len:364 (+),score=104.75 TRINITY_DN652_c0_g2_i4:66-1157(+)
MCIRDSSRYYAGIRISHANWENTWLTEAFSRFEARRWLFTATKSDELPQLESFIGYLQLIQEINELGDEYSTLSPNVTKNPILGVSPIIQGEKGFHLINKIYRVTDFRFGNKFIADWFHYFDRNRASSNDIMNLFRKDVFESFDFFSHYVVKTEAALPVAVKAVGQIQSEVNFTLPLIGELVQIANDYIQGKGTTSPDNWDNVKYYVAKAQIAFLQVLLNRTTDVTKEVVERVNQDLGDRFLKGETEVRASWLTLLASRFVGDKSEITEFLSSTGVLEHVRPIYKALKQVGQTSLAQQILDANSNFYHPYVVYVLNEDLNHQARLYFWSDFIAYSRFEFVLLLLLYPNFKNPKDLRLITVRRA